MSDNERSLNEVISSSRHKFSISSNEDPAERDSRLKIAEADAAHRRQLEADNARHQRLKELLLHILTAGVILTAVSLCSWILIKKGLTAEEGKLALGLLTAIVTGLVGYVTGRASK